MRWLLVISLADLRYVSIECRTVTAFLRWMT